MMENNPDTRQIPLDDPENIVKIRNHPSMGFVFLKAFLLSPFRSSTVGDNEKINKTRIILNNYQPDADKIQDYRQVCGFSMERPDIIPISYLQTLFIGLMGKFVTSPFFPVNPMGLVHISQSFEQKRPVNIYEILDLSCSLSGIQKTPKGIETRFNLEVLSQNAIVWQGTSTLFTRAPGISKIKKQKKERDFLKKKETILIPSGMGRKYASVSGDYNPFHLYTVLAKLFGFKKAIVHGMWSLARVVASLDREYGIHDSARVEVSFKLPIFMPATTALGYESQNSEGSRQGIVNFELYDEQKGLPHLKGRLLNNDQGS